MGMHTAPNSAPPTRGSTIGFAASINDNGSVSSKQGLVNDAPSHPPPLPPTASGSVPKLDTNGGEKKRSHGEYDGESTSSGAVNGSNGVPSMASMLKE